MIQHSIAVACVVVACVGLVTGIRYWSVTKDPAWLLARFIVVIGGSLALWFVPAQAGWLTGLLLFLIVLLPFHLFARAGQAERSGRYQQSARLWRWGHIFHPSRDVRFRLRLASARAAGGQEEFRQTLVAMEARGDQRTRGRARLLLAFEKPDWEELLVSSRSPDVAAAEGKPYELRTLGELGRLDEMVQVYETSARALPASGLKPSVLSMLAFTGRVENVTQMLKGAGHDYDSQTYWIAVARLQRDTADQSGQAMLKVLSEIGETERMRRVAAQRLSLAMQSLGPTALALETVRSIDAIIAAPANRQARIRKRRRIFSWLWLSLIVAIVVVVLERYFISPH